MIKRHHTIRTQFAPILILCGLSAPLAAKPYVCMEPYVGEFCLELLPEAAPNTVANFLRYVDGGRYTDSMIHRSEPGFVIQGGGYKVNSDFIDYVGSDAPITNEYNQSNLRGTVAMARQPGNADSATNQWFVNLADNTNLDSVDGGFTVFATVVSGMDVVDAIAALHRFDFRQDLQDNAFRSVPTTATPGPGVVVQLSQLIRVVRAYCVEELPGTAPELLPYQCSETSPGDALTEFCGSSLSFPVLVNGVLYEGTLDFAPGGTGLRFVVDKTKLKVISDTGQARATFAAGVLTIPSVRKGNAAFTDVKLELTGAEPLEFTLRTFTPR